MTASGQDLRTRWLDIVLNSVSYGLIATDRHGIIRTMTNAAADLAAVGRQECLGKPLSSVIRLLQPEDRAEVKLPSPRSFGKDHVPRGFSRVILLRKGGRELLVDAVFTPIITHDHRIAGAAVVFHDVGATVERERTALDRKTIDAIGNLAGSVARDFGSFLSLITGHASSIADNLIPQTHAHEAALQILEAAGQASDLTKRLLSIARASDFKNAGRTVEVNLAEIIGDAIGVTQGARSEPRVSFNIRNLHRMQTVQAEPNQLLDCLINLFRNAIDAMPNGGTITINASEKSENGKRFVILRISDTGSGIPKKHIDRIFEPLFSTKNSGSGIGMGLTVVKNAVESWGGQVKVRSRPGEGATFWIFLPKAKAKPFRRKKPALAMGGETVLVTDDKQDVLAEAAQTLERAGYSVMTARNADECVSLYREHSGKIHLTIVDAVMPGKNGKDVLQEILKLDPTASVIMTSGFSKDYVRSYLQVGAWGFVQKPFDTGQLLSVVRRTLDQRQATATTSNNRHRKEQST